jgi:hypothetical protein
VKRRTDAGPYRNGKDSPDYKPFTENNYAGIEENLSHPFYSLRRRSPPAEGHLFVRKTDGHRRYAKVIG